MDPDLPFTCRGCLLVVRNATLHSFDNEIVKDLFYRCTSVEISLEETHLPMQICTLCFGRCESWDSFQTWCQSNDEVLRKKYVTTVWDSDTEEVKPDDNFVPPTSPQAAYEVDVESTEVDQTMEDQYLASDDESIQMTPGSSGQNEIGVCVCEECGQQCQGELAYRKHKFHHEKNLRHKLRKLKTIEAKVESSGGKIEKGTEEELLVKSWTQKERKKLRESGQAYINKKANLIQKRSVKPVNCSCRHRCLENFTEAEREQIFKHYWSMDFGDKRRYVHQMVLERPCKRILTTQSRRSHTLEYSLNGKRVCKKFFCATLNIADQVIQVIKLKARQNMDVATDLRGHKTGQRRKLNSTLKSDGYASSSS